MHWLKAWTIDTFSHANLRTHSSMFVFWKTSLVLHLKNDYTRFWNNYERIVTLVYLFSENATSRRMSEMNSSDLLNCVLILIDLT